MMRGMFSAIAGLKTHQIMLDVAANDLANVNTIGYKAARTTFKDSLAQSQRGATAATAAQGGSNPAQVGLGVQLSSIDNQMQAGGLQSTGNVLDVAIGGEGWFRVAQSINAGTAVNLQYSRAGNFTRNTNGEIVTQDGYRVVGYNYDATATPPGPGATQQYIVIPSTATNVSIAQDGLVSYDDAAGVRQFAGYITLAKFPNEAGMVRSASNRWTTSPSSGVETIATPGTNGFGQTISGTVEMSNVDMATEFTSMITAQRGFQASSRVISISDQMLQDLTNMAR